MSSEAVLDEPSMALIERWLESGRYSSVGEAVRDGLRVLEALEKSESERLDALRVAIRAGLDSGPPAPLDMDAVKAEGRRRLDAARAASAHGG